MVTELIQWNCRGLKANINELHLLRASLCLSVICIQETILKPYGSLNIRGCTLYIHIHQAGDMATSGSSIIMNILFTGFCCQSNIT